MFRKILFGAVSLARPGDRRCPGRRHQGIPHRHPRRRERSRPPAQLPVPRRPAEDRCSASRRSRCSRPPTMTASSRACSAARSTIAELGASGYAKIYLEDQNAVDADPDHRPDRRLDRLLFDRWRSSRLRHQDARRPQGQEARLSPIRTRPRAI